MCGNIYCLPGVTVVFALFDKIVLKLGKLFVTIELSAVTPMNRRMTIHFQLREPKLFSQSEKNIYIFEIYIIKFNTHI